MSSTLLTDVVNNNINIPPYAATQQTSLTCLSQQSISNNNEPSEVTCQLIAPSNSIRCACNEDTCACDKAQRYAVAFDTLLGAKQAIGHRRSGSATVTTHKSSVKSHRRTVSSITSTTFNCPHRKPSTVVVILGAGANDGGPKDWTQLIVEHCKVNLEPTLNFLVLNV